MCAGPLLRQWNQITLVLLTFQFDKLSWSTLMCAALVGQIVGRTVALHFSAYIQGGSNVIALAMSRNPLERCVRLPPFPFCHQIRAPFDVPPVTTGRAGKRRAFCCREPTTMRQFGSLPEMAHFEQADAATRATHERRCYGTVTPTLAADNRGFALPSPVMRRASRAVTA